MKAIEEGIAIRKIVLGDLPEILMIEQECQLSPWSEDDYRAELDRSHSISIAASLNDRTAGFLIGRLITSDAEAEIYNIGVRKMFRRENIGSVLVRYFIDVCKIHGIDRVFLEVRQSNNEASAFYKKQGFEIAGIRKNFYGLPLEDALIMNLNLEKKQQNIFDKAFENRQI